MGRKKLVFMYIGDTDGFCAQELNFSSEERLHVNEGLNNNLKLTMVSDEKRIPAHFFGNSISEMNLLVGGNGSGKTTIMRIICQWICELSDGHFPEEEGVLVFKEDDTLYYTAFGSRRTLYVDTDDLDINILTVEKTKFFCDLKLVYFTNTSVRLGLDNYNILLDHSYSQRMREANLNGHAMVKDIITNYERYEFDRQIATALDMDDFPIHYIFLEVTDNSFEDIRKFLSIYGNDIINDLSGLWGKYFGKFSGEGASKSERLLIKLLQVVFHDMIRRLLLWNQESGDNRKAKVEEKLFLLTRGNGADDSGLDSGIRWIEQFLKDLLHECKKIYENSSFEDTFQNCWEGNCKYAIIFLRSMLLSKNRKQVERFLEIWEQVPMMSKGQKSVWKMRLEGNKDIFKEFWNHCRQIFLYMDNAYFYWDASSGQRSWAGLLPTLNYSSDHVQNIWFLLDEPNNTFHPEWERKLIQLIIDIMDRNTECKKQIWISTHSPIMLSDMPGPSVNYLWTDDSENTKMVIEQESNTFGQNIYYLYNNAFFLKDGVIGKFASQKIKKLIYELEKIEKKLLSDKNTKKTKKKINKRIDRCEEVAKLVSEPVYSKQIQYFLTCCRMLAKKKGKND